MTRTLRDELVAKVVKTGNMTDQQVETKQAKLQAQAAAIRMSRDEEEKERKRKLRAQRKLEREEAARRALEEDDDTPEYEPALNSSDRLESFLFFEILKRLY